jgi:methionyl-tRNA formyltransferase
MNLGIILTPDERSKAYLQKILKNNIILDNIIFMNDNRIKKIYSDNMIELSKINGFDISKSVNDTLLENNLTFKEFPFVDINNSKLIKHIQSLSVDYMIFTGGGILKHDVLKSGTKFIHLHPGIVPDYRGSTCFYYSILNENYAGVTAFLMDENLDTGDILHQKKFQKPSYQYLDEIYDPHIRSETLIELLQTKKNFVTQMTKQDPLFGETYYIIHPTLKHIAILNCINDD